MTEPISFADFTQRFEHDALRTFIPVQDMRDAFDTPFDDDQTLRLEEVRERLSKSLAASERLVALCDEKIQMPGAKKTTRVTEAILTQPKDIVARIVDILDYLKEGIELVHEYLAPNKTRIQNVYARTLETFIRGITQNTFCLIGKIFKSLEKRHLSEEALAPYEKILNHPISKLMKQALAASQGKK